MEIFVNGEPRDMPVGTTVAELLVAMNLQPRFLAVERNFELVPRQQHAAATLQPGDRLEVVTLVGGG